MSFNKFLEKINNSDNIYGDFKYNKITWRQFGDLISLKSKSSRYDYNYACNGLIIAKIGGKFEVICRPRPHFTYTSKSVDKWADPVIYKVTDGSIFNIYHCRGLCAYEECEGAWHWASTNLCDIASMSWRGVMYNDVILELDKTDYSKLDPRFTYTIGIQHKKLHPFEGKNKMWFISYQNNNTGKIITDLPDGFKCDKQSVSKIEPFKESYYRALTYRCKIAFNKYKKYNKINYGYIVQSGSKIMLFESTLFTKIKRCIYMFPKIGKQQRQIMAELYSQWSYVLAINYVNNKDVFLLLFPQYKKLFVKVSKQINYIEKLITLTKIAKQKLPQEMSEEQYKMYRIVETHIQLNSEVHNYINLTHQIANIISHRIIDRELKENKNIKI